MNNKYEALSIQFLNCDGKEIGLIKQASGECAWDESNSELLLKGDFVENLLKLPPLDISELRLNEKSVCVQFWPIVPAISSAPEPGRSIAEIRLSDDNIHLNFGRGYPELKLLDADDPVKKALNNFMERFCSKKESGDDGLLPE